MAYYKRQEDEGETDCEVLVELSSCSLLCYYCYCCCRYWDYCCCRRAKIGGKECDFAPQRFHHLMPKNESEISGIQFYLFCDHRLARIQISNFL